MPDQAPDEIQDGESLLYIGVIFMTVVMERYGFSIIAVNPGKSDRGSAQVTADIFDYGIRVTFFGLCVNIKPVFIVSVTEGFGLFKRRADAPLQLIEQGSAESIAQIGIVKMGNILPEAVVGKAAFGDKTVDVRIPLEVASKGMQDHDEARGVVFRTVHPAEERKDNAGDCVKEAVKERAVFKEKRAQKFIDGEDAVPVPYADKLKGHIGSTFHGVLRAAGGAEAALAAERDKFELTAGRAAVHGAAKRGISAAEHLIDIFDLTVPGMEDVLNLFVMV